VSVCRSRGANHLRLRVAPTNTGAIRFYTRYASTALASPRTRVPLDVMEKYIGFGEPHPVGPVGLVTV
jgi:ribosomal protein S18 acetylase RimI-like enzyme